MEPGIFLFQTIAAPAVFPPLAAVMRPAPAGGLDFALALGDCLGSGEEEERPQPAPEVNPMAAPAPRPPAEAPPAASLGFALPFSPPVPVTPAPGQNRTAAEPPLQPAAAPLGFALPSVETAPESQTPGQDQTVAESPVAASAPEAPVRDAGRSDAPEPAPMLYEPEAERPPAGEVPGRPAGGAPPQPPAERMPDAERAKMLKAQPVPDEADARPQRDIQPAPEMPAAEAPVRTSPPERECSRPPEIEVEVAPSQPATPPDVRPAQAPEPPPQAAQRAREHVEAPQTAPPAASAARAAAPESPMAFGARMEERGRPAADKPAEPVPAAGSVAPRRHEPAAPEPLPKPAASLQPAAEPAAPPAAPPAMQMPAASPARPAQAEAAPPPEPLAPPDPPRGQPVREISVRLAGPEENVEIRMAERAGEIRVAVHAGGSDLRRVLADGLPELVHCLENRGFTAEAWRARESDPPPGDGDLPRGGEESERHDHRGRRRHPQPEWLDEMARSLGPEPSRSDDHE